MPTLEKEVYVMFEDSTAQVKGYLGCNGFGGKFVSDNGGGLVIRVGNAYVGVDGFCVGLPGLLPSPKSSAKLIVVTFPRASFAETALPRMS